MPTGQPDAYQVANKAAQDIFETAKPKESRCSKGTPACLILSACRLLHLRIQEAEATPRSPLQHASEMKVKTAIDISIDRDRFSARQEREREKKNQKQLDEEARRKATPASEQRNKAKYAYSPK